jgi:site-specific recombinase XerD
MVNAELSSKNNQEESLVLSGLISFLVHDTPTLESLSRDEMKAVARAMVFDTLKEDLKQRVEFAKINLPEKKALFLERYSKRSKATLIAYTKSIAELEEWSDRTGVPILAMKGKDADKFIHDIPGSSSTIRLKTAAISSFFTFLERETDGRIRNPFRGTKERPKRKTKTPEVPSLNELEAIKAELSPPIRAAVVMMMEHGLRVGALNGLTVWGGKFSSVSKGKEVLGQISETALEAIKEAGLDTRSPWSNLNQDAIRNAFRYASARLYRERKIQAPYSVHDIRHYFAINDYKKNKDIYRLKILLNHASIQVTELYLKGLELFL